MIKLNFQKTLPKKSRKNSPKANKAEATQIKSEKVTEPICYNTPSLEVEQPVAAADAPKVAPKSNGKRRKNKKDNVMDSIPVESEPIQPFGCQQTNSVKKGANKLSKLERKALRQVKESLKKLQSKEQAEKVKLPEIPQEEEQEVQEEEEEEAAELEFELNFAVADELEVQAVTDEEALLKNIKDARLRRTLMRIINKINYL